MKPEIEDEIGFFAPGYHPVGRLFAPAIGCYAGLPFPGKVQNMHFMMLRVNSCLPDWQDAQFIAERDYDKICDQYENLPPSLERFILFKEAFKELGYVPIEE